MSLRDKYFTGRRKGPRTNNSVEAWHGVLNRYAVGTPRMIDLLEIIHREESHCRQAYREYFLNPSKGLKQRHQRHNYSRHDKELVSIVDRYESDYFGLPIDYLAVLANHCHQ
ncbi:hypothetical protein QR680_011473 [Steinernema hermaphroditum]|uniref:Uncharacterized protein n=1 Tax=Steinernema hermaphroditum TaxID=289476 RepID=A0AA39LZ14_9BILA|nr:hypothetical protein QR680_011473 [Steinernema hermaphroditum]